MYVSNTRHIRSNNMPEWLMGPPAKRLDYVRVGSNPTVVDSR